MSVPDIQAFLAEHCDTKASPDQIVLVIDDVAADSLTGRSLPLGSIYPVLFIDTPRVTIRGDGWRRQNTAVRLALRIGQVTQR